jgi:hypothetical protein
MSILPKTPQDDDLVSILYDNPLPMPKSVTIGELAKEAKDFGVPCEVAAYSAYIAIVSQNNNGKHKLKDLVKIFKEVYEED